MTKQSPIKQDRSFYTEARKGNATGEKEFQEKAKESKTYLFPLLGVPQNKFAEDLVQTNVGPGLTF